MRCNGPTSHQPTTAHCMETHLSHSYQPLSYIRSHTLSIYLYNKRGGWWYNKADFEFSGHCHTPAYSGWVWTSACCYGGALSLFPFLLTLCSVPFSPHSVPSQAGITALLHIIMTFEISHSTVYQYLIEAFHFWFSFRCFCLFLTQYCYYFHLSIPCDVCITLIFLRSILTACC